MSNRPLLIALAATAGAISLAACETDTYGGASTSDTAVTSARPDNSGVNAGASSSRSSTAAQVPSSEDPPAPSAR